MKPQYILLRKYGIRVGYMVVFVGISLLIYWSIVSVFIIQTIEVVGANVSVEVDATLLPKTLLFFPSEKIRLKLLSDNPVLADIQFKKKYPNTLVIITKLRKPAARVKARDRTVLVDETGIVLGDADSSSPSVATIVIPIEGLRVGQSISDPKFIQSLAFLVGIADIVPVSDITVQNDGSLQAVSGKLNILFTQDSDIGVTLATLQTLFAGFRIKGTLPTVIDLRFDKPIVKF